MAQIVSHVFVSAKADGTDPLQVQPSHWNQNHAATGGNTGSILCRDASDATYGMSWVQSVATGQVLTSAGAGTLPAWSASPTLTSYLFTGDNAGDVGAAANRARTGYFGTALVVGTNPATTGLGRFANAGTLTWRNAANNADFDLVSFSVLNVAQFGSGGATTDIYGTSVHVVSVGPHAIGGATSADVQFLQTGTFAAGVTLTQGYLLNSIFTLPVNLSASAWRVNPTFTEAASGNHGLLATVHIEAATVTAGAATVTNTASLYIGGPMTATVSGANYNMWSASGTAFRWQGYGAGAATFDANGNITSVSDARLKTNVRDYAYGLDAVRRLRPVTFNWNEKTHLDRVNEYVGFLAHEVETVLGPTSVGRDENGYLTLQDRAILGAAVRAIQDLAEKYDRLTG